MSNEVPYGVKVSPDGSLIVAEELDDDAYWPDPNDDPWLLGEDGWDKV